MVGKLYLSDWFAFPVACSMGSELTVQFISSCRARIAADCEEGVDLSQIRLFFYGPLENLLPAQARWGLNRIAPLPIRVGIVHLSAKEMRRSGRSSFNRKNKLPAVPTIEQRFCNCSGSRYGLNRMPFLLVYISMTPPVATGWAQPKSKPHANRPTSEERI